MLLPEGWRAEAMRRVMGGDDVVSAVGSASVAMNIVRSVHGVDVRQL